jgi:hypothetical protein
MTFGSNRPTLGRKAKEGRRKIGEPRRWLSWGKRVGRDLGKAGSHQILRRDAEPFQAKSLILCCLEKLLAS